MGREAALTWLNIRLSALRSPEYIGSDPVARATWFNLVAYCAEQENGGRIVGAKKWKDRQWQQTCGVTLAEVDAAPHLLKWDGDDIAVWNYPAEKEAEVRIKREAGHVGGSRSGKVRAKHAAKQKGSTASSSASSSASTEGEGEGEGEGERKEKKNRASADWISLPPVLDSAEFRVAWEKYVSYRKKRHIAPLLPESVELQWKKMADWGMSSAIAQIEETIRSGWQGIFAPRASNGAKPAPEPRPPIPYMAPRDGL